MLRVSYNNTIRKSLTRRRVAAGSLSSIRRGRYQDRRLPKPPTAIGRVQPAGGPCFPLVGDAEELARPNRQHQTPRRTRTRVLVRRKRCPSPQIPSLLSSGRGKGSLPPKVAKVERKCGLARCAYVVGRASDGEVDRCMRCLTSKRKLL